MIIIALAIHVRNFQDRKLIINVKLSKLKLYNLWNENLSYVLNLNFMIFIKKNRFNRIISFWMGRKYCINVHLKKIRNVFFFFFLKNHSFFFSVKALDRKLLKLNMYKFPRHASYSNLNRRKNSWTAPGIFLSMP